MLATKGPAFLRLIAADTAVRRRSAAEGSLDAPHEIMHARDLPARRLCRENLSEGLGEARETAEHQAVIGVGAGGVTVACTAARPRLNTARCGLGRAVGGGCNGLVHRCSEHRGGRIRPCRGTGAHLGPVLLVARRLLTSCAARRDDGSNVLDGGSWCRGGRIWPCRSTVAHLSGRSNCDLKGSKLLPSEHEYSRKGGALHGHARWRRGSATARTHDPLPMTA